MIIHDQNSETESSSSPTKTSHSLLSSAPGVQRREPSPGPAPPSYMVATSITSDSAGPSSPLLGYQPGSSARADRIHPQMMSQSYQDEIARAVLEQRRRDIVHRTRHRFFKGFCIAILCYFLIMAFIGSVRMRFGNTPWNGMPPPHVPHAPSPPSHPAASSPPRANPTNIDQLPGTPSQSRPWPQPRDGHVIECVGEDYWSPSPPSTPFIQESLNDWTISTPGKDEDLPYTAYSTFSLPLNATENSIFSRGRHASGSMLLLTRDADDDEESIKIIIQASYRYKEALSCTTICNLQQDHGGRALGIYTPRDFNGSRDIWFTITVYFPKSPSVAASPRDMGVFSASLSWFNYAISTMNDVSFKHLTLATVSDKLHSKGVVAEVLTLASSNGAITGSFNVTGEGVFATSNGEIDVDLNIFHVDEEGPPKGAKVTLTTNNAPIRARNSLYHNTGTQGHASSSGGNFTVVTTTTNAHVNVSFATAPVDSTLKCVVSTKNGNASARMHPTFEGDVTMLTTNGKSELHQSDGIEDPSGRGRNRIVALKSMWKTWLVGWVGWGEEKKAGSLVITTSNGQSRLEL